MLSLSYGPIFTLVLVLACSLWSPHASAQNPQMGQAQYSIGTLLILRPDGVEERLRGQGALSLFELDVLKTDQSTRSLIALGDGIRVALNESTTVHVHSRWEKAHGTTKILRLKKGEVWVSSAAGGKPLEVETATGVAIVQNAEMDFKISETGQTVLTVVQGTVPLATPYGSCVVNASASSSAARGRGCSVPVSVNAQQAVGWSRDLPR